MPLSINGKLIPDRTLDRELLRLSSGLEMDAPHAGGNDPAHLRSLALRNVINRALLLQAAAAHKLHITADEIEAELVRRWGVHRSTVCDPGSTEALREDLLVDRISADLTRHVPRPGRADTEQFYRANQHLYRVAEAVEAAHIVCGFTCAEEEPAARVTIEQAESELLRGKSFQQVANCYSDCKGVGGNVGWVHRGVMVQEFEDAVFALQTGQRSKIFRTVFGFHLATALRRRNAGVTPFSAVRLQIAKHMFLQLRQQALQQALTQIKTQSDIHFSEEAALG